MSRYGRANWLASAQNYFYILHLGDRTTYLNVVCGVNSLALFLCDSSNNIPRSRLCNIWACCLSVLIL